MREALEIREVEFPVSKQSPRPVPRPPVPGVALPAESHPVITDRSRREVLASFFEQQLRLRIGGRLIAVRPSQGPDPNFPFAHPVLVVSGRHSAGPDLESLPAVALSADREWLDRMQIVRDGMGGRQLAKVTEAPYALLWSAQGMQILDTEAAVVVGAFEVGATAIEHRCCPLIPGARPGDRCRMEGGGAFDRAIVAAGNWLDRRYEFWSELGCDEACGVATERDSDRLPTRYRKWMTEVEIDQAWQRLSSQVWSKPEVD